MSWSLTEAILDRTRLLGWVCRLPAGELSLPGRARDVADLLVSYSQLARRTRGFARSEGQAIALFVLCWHARQMLRQLPPKYRRVSLYHFDWNTPASS